MELGLNERPHERGVLGTDGDEELLVASDPLEPVSFVREGGVAVGAGDEQVVVGAGEDDSGDHREARKEQEPAGEDSAQEVALGADGGSGGSLWLVSAHDGWGSAGEGVGLESWARSVGCGAGVGSRSGSAIGSGLVVGRGAVE